VDGGIHRSYRLILTRYEMLRDTNFHPLILSRAERTFFENSLNHGKSNGVFKTTMVGVSN